MVSVVPDGCRAVVHNIAGKIAGPIVDAEGERGVGIPTPLDLATAVEGIDPHGGSAAVEGGAGGNGEVG